MTAWTTTLAYNSTTPASCTWSAPAPNGAWPLCLQPNDTLTISFSGFPTGSTMSSVDLVGGGNTISYPPLSPASGGDFTITSVSTPTPYDVSNNTFTVTIADNQAISSGVIYEMSMGGNTGGTNPVTWGSGDSVTINQSFWNVTLTYDDDDATNCDWSNPMTTLGTTSSWPLHLKQSETLTISFLGFPVGSTLTSLTLLGNNGTEINFPTQTSNNDFSVAYSQPLNSLGMTVTITDNENPSSQVQYTMTVTGTVGGTNATWSGDPEVINNPGS